MDGVREFDVEILDVRAHTDNNTTYVIGDIVGAVAAKVENAFPQGPIWLDPEKALAEGDKDRNMKDGIGSQLMQLQPVHEE